MRIFLSYAHEQKPLATGLATALRGDGHYVFFDGTALSTGAPYDQVIREEIAASDAFVFLVSPESIEEGGYARTELRFALEKWPSPRGRLLPVLVAKVKEYPPELRVTVLEPRGDLVAEVAKEVDGLARALKRRLLWRAAAAIGAVVLVAAGLLAWRGPVRTNGVAASPAVGRYECSANQKKLEDCEIQPEKADLRFQFSVPSPAGISNRLQGKLTRSMGHADNCWTAKLERRFSEDGEPLQKMAGGALWLCQKEEKWTGTWTDGTALDFIMVSSPP